MGQNAHFPPEPVNPAGPRPGDRRVLLGPSAERWAGGLADIGSRAPTTGPGSIRGPASFCGADRPAHYAWAQISLQGAMPAGAPASTPLAGSQKRHRHLCQGGRGPAGKRRAGNGRAQAPAYGRFRRAPARGGGVDKYQRVLAHLLPKPSVHTQGTGAPRLLCLSTISNWAFRHNSRPNEAWCRAWPLYLRAPDRAIGTPGVQGNASSSVRRSAARLPRPRRRSDRPSARSLLTSWAKTAILALPTMPGAAPLKSTSFEQHTGVPRAGPEAALSFGPVGLPADQPAARLRGRRTLRDLADRPRRLGLDFDRFGTPDHGKAMTMDTLTRMRAFIAVVEAEGFSAAARKIGAPRRCCRNMCANWRTNSAPCCSTARRVSSR